MRHREYSTSPAAITYSSKVPPVVSAMRAMAPDWLASCPAAPWFAEVDAPEPLSNAIKRARKPVSA